MGKEAFLEAWNLVEDQDACVDHEDILRVGSLVALKEPILSRSSSTKLDSNILPAFYTTEPLEFLELSEEHAMAKHLLQIRDEEMSFTPESTESLRKRGNKFFKAGRYGESYRCYSRGIRNVAHFNYQSDDAEVALRVNRAAAAFHLNMLRSGISDVESVLVRHPTDRRSLARLGILLQGAGEFHSALEAFENIRRLYPGAEEAVNGIQMTEKLMKESLGIFDYLNLETGSHANFRGPFLIREVHGRGLGAIATESISSGTLILAEKALAYSSSSATHGASIESLLSLCFKISHLLKEEADKCDVVYSLFAGHDAPDPQSRPSQSPDLRHIESVIHFNVYQKVSEQHVSSGLWPLLARFNHDCVSNTIRVQFQDHVFLFASRNIELGEEITTGYVSHELPIEMRTHALRRFGFVCECQLCAHQRQEDPNLAEKRRKILLDIESAIVPDLFEIDSSEEALLELEDAVSQMKSTFGHGTKMRDELVFPLMTLGLKYEEERKYDLAGETFREACEASLVPDDTLKVAAFRAYTNFSLAKREQDASESMQLLIHTYSLTTGGDKKAAEGKLHRDVLKDMY